MQRDGNEQQRRRTPEEERVIAMDGGVIGGMQRDGGVRVVSTGLPGSPVKRKAPPMKLEPGEHHPLEGVEGYQDLVDPENIPPAMMSEARELSEVFGMYVIQCFYSKTWQLREAALSKIILEFPRVLNDGGMPRSQLFLLTCRMLQTCASEKVANVFSKSINFLKLVLTGVASDIHRSEVTAGLERYTLTLVEKLGNTNARVRQDASNALMAMARSNSVGPAYVAIILLKKPKKELPTAFRPILGRMQVLQNIIEQFGFFNDLSMDAIMGHLKACNAFAHGKDQVRDMARQITVECYRNFGDGVRCVCFSFFLYNMCDFQDFQDFQSFLSSHTTTRYNSCPQIFFFLFPWFFLQFFLLFYIFLVLFAFRNHLKDLRPKQLEEYEAAFNGGAKGSSNVRRQPKPTNAGKKKNKTKPSGDEGNKAKRGGSDKARAPQGQDSGGGGGGGGGGGSGGGGGGGSGGGGDISVTQQPTGDGQRLTISNAAGDGRDININISMQASPVKRGGGGGIEMGADVDGEGDDNPFTW